ncbi:cryptochrome/photolyase family protein [Streptomyces sp. NPDC001941]|uniref:cryptochrome/photolyase family protein n=1 Tax=Streptomyces sp. NPDC001941 TaxID=3154659 RepID=UPI003317955C
MARSLHWLFGDQLGPHFLAPSPGGPDAADGPEPGPGPDTPLVMVESRAVLRRRRFHRAKAHLVLSAMRHRAAELGDRVTYVRAATYREGLARALGHRRADVTVSAPTTRAARALVADLEWVRTLPARGFLVGEDRFGEWLAGRDGHRLLFEDFYRWVRRDQDLLMDGDQPAGGRWNFDHDNRRPPPSGARVLGAPAPWTATEDEIDEEVRRDLDAWERSGEVAFTGADGPRVFPVTRAEALEALHQFVDFRLADFGRYEDAMLARDPWMSHSMLSVPLNLGLLDPYEVVEAAERAWREGRVPLASAEGFVRQIAGWREYVWNLYWHFGEDYRHRNVLRHRRVLPDWFQELDADRVTARCLSTVLADVRDRGWVHHIPRLMVLGSYALQQGWDPAAVNDWFHRNFTDGYDWVMLPNVIGMSQYADGGRMTTKPYTSGGAYINKMSDLCEGCAYRPSQRVGDTACPYTTGYWSFLHRHRERLSHNHRMRPMLSGLDRVEDLEAMLSQHRERGREAP